jgi:hypothetical protein
MSEPRVLMEHFFRHEFGRLVAVLTRFPAAPRTDLREGRNGCTMGTQPKRYAHGEA